MIDQLDEMPAHAAEAILLNVCGSARWSRAMMTRRPFGDLNGLRSAAAASFDHLDETDWLEAFRAHPRIGEVAPAESLAASEQRAIVDALGATMARIIELNQVYDARFGRIFLIRAAGRTSAEILRELERRLINDDATELGEAAREQREISLRRLETLFSP
ncbi:MAG: 2-oxo-4-hydroxy-4-carboxy-5-ureidoimidazoline decarboxylase [Gemmatimonadaceae bacterium]